MKIKDSPGAAAALSPRINEVAPGKPKEKMDASLSLKAFMRMKTLETSAWYMASLTTYLVEKKDSNGDFSLMESLLVPGHEPPPHVHSREDELYYVLDGRVRRLRRRAGLQAQTQAARVCHSLPSSSFVLIITPGGLEEAFRTVASPAQNLELPFEHRFGTDDTTIHSIRCAPSGSG